MEDRVRALVRQGCLTCRRALDYMRSKGVEFETRDLVKEPLSKEALREILDMLGLRPSDLLRTRDRMYRELDLKNRRPSDDELLDLMVRYPGLIKRPILIRGDRAVVALTPEEVDRIL